VIGIYAYAYCYAYCYTYTAARDFAASLKRHTYVFHFKPVSPLTPEGNKSAYNPRGYAAAQPLCGKSD
jgi:hypothetical protein